MKQFAPIGGPTTQRDRFDFRGGIRSRASDHDSHFFSADCLLDGLTESVLAKKASNPNGPVAIAVGPFV
jgi:hypothetical protein